MMISLSLNEPEKETDYFDLSEGSALRVWTCRRRIGCAGRRGGRRRRREMLRLHGRRLFSTSMAILLFRV